MLLTGALLVAVKFAFIPAVLVNSLLIGYIYKDSNKLRVYLIFKLIILTILFAFLLTPGAWHQPLLYVTNDISLMSKFNWSGCSKLLNSCVITTSDQWNTGLYLVSWYAAQTPLLFIILFSIGIVTVIKKLLNKNSHLKTKWIVLLVQLLLFPLLAIVHNSIFYDATRHTIFCIPIIVIISGVGLQFLYEFKDKVLRIILLLFIVILSLILLTDDFLLNPYQYSYYNEIVRGYINNKNSETDFWGFSLREAYEKTNNEMYYSQYLSLISFPQDLLLPYINDITLVKYHKDMQLPQNTSINVIGGDRDNQIDNAINPNRCLLVTEVSRRLLFKIDPLIMSKGYHCE